MVHMRQTEALIDQLGLPPPGRKGAIGYKDIVNAIVLSIVSGRLRLGEKLPPQRELSFQIGVAVGTANRAYQELERRGLVKGEVGRGTFVCRLSERGKFAASPPDTEGSYDLTINRPPAESCSRSLTNALRALSNRPDLDDLIRHQPSAGKPEHRAAAADWLCQMGFSMPADRIVICNGVQHAIAVVLGALAAPGDLMVTEEINYPGIRHLQRLYNLRIMGLPMDSFGLIPEALDEACRQGDVRFVYCTPTVHNPTAAVMPPDRRKAIADIIARYSLTLIENDIYGLMHDAPILPISVLVPDNAHYITGTSKCIGAGIRLGYVVAPTNTVNEIASAVQATTWFACPLMSEIVSTWITTGEAKKIVDWNRNEARTRQEIAARVLKDVSFTSHPVSYHIWLKLPDPWRTEDFVRQAAAQKVYVTSSETYMLGRRPAPHAVRIALGGIGHRGLLEQALIKVVKILGEGPRMNELGS